MAITGTNIVRGLVLTASSVGLVAGAPVLAVSASPTYVSRTGSDSNACTINSPCKTFTGALANTAPGGEIDCLDAGVFGPVTIRKSVTINCVQSNIANIVVTDGTAITIPNDAALNVTVVLDGLNISGSGSGQIGITFRSSGVLIVRNTKIHDFNSQAIAFSPKGDSTLSVDNAVIDNISPFAESPDAIPFGTIHVGATGKASARASIVRTQINNSGIGVLAYGSASSGSVFVSVRSSTIANSSVYGALAYNRGAFPSLFATIAIDDSTISGSAGAGLYANGSPAGMLVNNSTITNNQGGGLVMSSGGVIYSYGNNRVNGNNKMDGSFTATIAQR